MERTIKVTGRGTVHLKPDTVRLNITQEGTCPSYAGTMEEMTLMKGELNKMLTGLGFDKSDLKTVSFSIDPKFESVETRSGNYKRRFAGYEYTHYLKLEFPVNNELLGRVLFGLTKGVGNPKFSMDYTVKDTEAAKNELLANAVADSAAKAKVLTDAAGVKLGGIRNIDYSWGTIEFSNRMADMRLDCVSAPMEMPSRFDMDVEPDDIENSDTVTVVWEIG